MARELQTGKSRYEFLTEAGLNIEVCPKHSVEDGIMAVRKMLPITWFNKDTTKFGLECLRNYRRVFNEKLNVYEKLKKRNHSTIGVAIVQMHSDT